LGGGSNSISLWCVIRKRLEATRQGALFSKFAFAEHHARSDQLNPSIRVTRRLLQAIGKTLHHCRWHLGRLGSRFRRQAAPEIRRLAGLCSRRVARSRAYDGLALTSPQTRSAAICWRLMPARFDRAAGITAHI
jgi:hypothetical protein